MNLITWEQQEKNKIEATRKAAEEFAENLEAELQAFLKNYPLSIFVYGGYYIGHDTTKNCFVYQQLVNMVPNATEIWKEEVLKKNGVTCGYSADFLEDAVSQFVDSIHGKLISIHKVSKEEEVYHGQISGRIVVEFNV